MKSYDITFVAAFGDEDRIVNLSSPSGAGGNCYHIMIDNFYYGVIVKRFRWEVCFQIYTDQYTQAELDTLLERLMLIYNFQINSYDVGVTAEDENEYYVSLDGVYVGMIYTEFIDAPPFMVWKTRDLIAEDLVEKIGAAIEAEDH